MATWGGWACHNLVGRGGKGGHGGGGGGGGGYSISVLRHNSTFDGISNTLNTGTPGDGGSEGFSSGNPGFPSLNGLAQENFSHSNVTAVPALAAPVATYALLVTEPDTPAAPVKPLVADDYAGSYTFIVLIEPEFGTASVVGGQLTYTPKPGYSGMDFFPFRASRDSGGSVDGFAVVVVESSCYANCDGSTVEPVLNVDDFTCFINEFAIAQSLTHEEQIEHYANCDGSTAAPVLTVDDFTCFINAFAAGCP